MSKTIMCDACGLHHNFIDGYVPRDAKCARCSKLLVTKSDNKKLLDEAINDNDKENTCMKCLNHIGNDNDRFVFRVANMGYGSSFDGVDSTVILCPNCHKESNVIWNNDIRILEGGFTCYKHEEDMLNYIDSFPLAGKELFWNRLDKGISYWMYEPQEYIDELKRFEKA